MNGACSSATSTETPEPPPAADQAPAADGTASRSRALGHATSGPALQQNLVCVMEAG